MEYIHGIHASDYPVDKSALERYESFKRIKEMFSKFSYCK